MNEPMQTLIQAALEVLLPTGIELRRRGWDAQLHQEVDEEAPAVWVSLRIAIPDMPVPVVHDAQDIPQTQTSS